jgi:hypothetical protein
VHASTGWHVHPGPSLILVAAGTVTNVLIDFETTFASTIEELVRRRDERQRS